MAEIYRRTWCELLSQMVNKQVILHDVTTEVGNRCVLEDVGADYIGVRFRTGKRTFYNLKNVISVQEVDEEVH